MGPRIWDIAKRLRQRRQDDESGAEMVEFAFVVVLLIALLYGIITYGLILAGQATITQAAADAARAGIVQGTGTTTCHGVANVSAAGCAAADQANTDIGWMNKTCQESVNGTTVVTGTDAPGTTNPIITCSATTLSPPNGCPSSPTSNTCLSVTVQYNYSTSPLFPELPGLSVITPSTISSTNVLQLSTPSGQ